MYVTRLLLVAWISCSSIQAELKLQFWTPFIHSLKTWTDFRASTCAQEYHLSLHFLRALSKLCGKREKKRLWWSGEFFLWPQWRINHSHSSLCGSLCWGQWFWFWGQQTNYEWKLLLSKGENTLGKRKQTPKCQWIALGELIKPQNFSNVLLNFKPNKF